MSEFFENRKKEFIFTRDPLYNEVGAEGEFMIRHIDSELQGLKDLALQMGGCVEKAFDSACQTVVGHNPGAFDVVHKHEARINELQIQIDEACVNVLAKQAPVAKDLRLVIAITKINTDLERMGDQSINIALSARDLYKSWPKSVLPTEIKQMMEEVRGMVRSVLDAFADRNVEVSRQVLQKDDLVDELKDSLIRHMKTQMVKSPEQVEIGLEFITIAKNLERMADHATNIAEEVIYLATGKDVRHGHSVSVGS